MVGPKTVRQLLLSPLPFGNAQAACHDHTGICITDGTCFLECNGTCLFHVEAWLLNSLSMFVGTEVYKSEPIVTHVTPMILWHEESCRRVVTTFKFMFNSGHTLSHRKQSAACWWQEKQTWKSSRFPRLTLHSILCPFLILTIRIFPNRRRKMGKQQSISQRASNPDGIWPASIVRTIQYHLSLTNHSHECSLFTVNLPPDDDSVDYSRSFTKY